MSKLYALRNKAHAGKGGLLLLVLVVAAVIAVLGAGHLQKDGLQPVPLSAGDQVSNGFADYRSGAQGISQPQHQ
jgi:hypothetical protein